MKVFLVIAALVAVAAAEISLHAVFQAKWNRFKAAHGKNYHRDEEPQRIQAFLENVHHIESHNEKFHKGHESYELNHNQFADMSHEEFKKTMLGYNPSFAVQASMNETMFEYNPGLEMPTGVDWRRTTPHVKNQGSCGSCYSFSALGAIEGALNRKWGHVYDLSEQNIVDCSGRYGNGGCNGGLMTTTFNYVKDNGVNYAYYYPYEGKVGQCRFKTSNGNIKVSNHVRIPTDNEPALKQALSTVGPISVAMDASPRSIMFYSRGIYEDPSCSPSRLNHAVLAVGYGTENNIPYILIKNSWGESWGEGGYIKLRADRNTCGVARDACYPIL